MARTRGRKATQEKQQKRITFAIVGAGEVTETNVRDLLNDRFEFGEPDEDGNFAAPDDLVLSTVVPVTESHFVAGPDAVLTWVDSFEGDYIVVTDADRGKGVKDVKDILEYAEEVVENDNVTHGLIDVLLQARDEGGNEVFLVVSWGEDGDDNSEVALDLAAANEIKAYDLSAGLDDLSFATEDAPTDEPEPEKSADPEPESEPEEKPKRGRARGKARGKAEEPLEDAEKPLEDDEPAEEGLGQRLQRQTRERKDARDEGEKVDETPTPDAVEKGKQVADETEGKIDDVKTGGSAKDLQAKVVDLDLENRFGFHPATDVTGPQHSAVRHLALQFAQALDKMLPNGREKSQAITAVQEAMMWSNAAIAINGAPLGDEPTAEGQAAQADAKPSTPRSASPKTVTEIFNDETEEWEKKGRGRMPKDARWRKVNADGKVVDAFIQEDMES